jgi:hypothetical protein
VYGEIGSKSTPLNFSTATVDGNTAQGGNGGAGGSGGGGTGLAGAGGAAFGGGQYLDGISHTTATLTNCTVQTNSALGGFGAGGTGSEASGQGGGLFITPSGITVFLDAATVAQVTGNTASDGAAFDDIVGPYTLT